MGLGGAMLGDERTRSSLFRVPCEAGPRAQASSERRAATFGAGSPTQKGGAHDFWRAPGTSDAQGFAG
jgi:hypothetical protein